jgi:hypothetical protein
MLFMERNKSITDPWYFLFCTADVAECEVISDGIGVRRVRSRGTVVDFDLCVCPGRDGGRHGGSV